MMQKYSTTKATTFLKISELSLIEELSDESASAISGGRFKKIGNFSESLPTIASPDGEPIDVYVDGVRVNSVSTGYAG